MRPEKGFASEHFARSCLPGARDRHGRSSALQIKVEPKGLTPRSIVSFWDNLTYDRILS